MLGGGCATGGVATKTGVVVEVVMAVLSVGGAGVFEVAAEVLLLFGLG